MKALKLSYCPPVERKSCIRWIEKLFKDCLCNRRDEISFGLGIASLVGWALAEIPQIITNFNNKSATGVSIAFLSTWIIGDVFNLVGCILEPATLPTQFYTAVLYTTVTIILTLQCIYYNHFLQWWKRGQEPNKVKDETEPLQPMLHDRLRATADAPVEAPRRRDFYFMSARSLAGSETTPNEHYMKARSGQHTDSSDDEPLSTTTPVVVTQPRAIPRPVKYGTFVAAAANLPRLSRARGMDLSGKSVLFQEQQLYEINAYGQSLGWLMVAIYMGGRIPQILLNKKRGSVEGLNPLMFVFALVANVTYVGSILVRSSEWRKIKANMPWLLDAISLVPELKLLRILILTEENKFQRSLVHRCFNFDLKYMAIPETKFGLQQPFHSSRSNLHIYQTEAEIHTNNGFREIRAVMPRHPTEPFPVTLPRARTPSFQVTNPGSRTRVL
ncbi:probable vacuolar amino acid transporter ypq1 [Phtheirospermum japonicum]|uniref:Probable vacuolar amino acid transporter ypq1 n=1 Tax=Phtheirospermum japonicum TaxID=374723 RepID=A0A830DD12_9LAMI|nr:probable vacuolar amino acid transporter ypq1 [Phtheirospermum japonicum]